MKYRSLIFILSFFLVFCFYSYAGKRKQSNPKKVEIVDCVQISSTSWSCRVIEDEEEKEDEGDKNIDRANVCCKPSIYDGVDCTVASEDKCNEMERAGVRTEVNFSGLDSLGLLQTSRVWLNLPNGTKIPPTVIALGGATGNSMFSANEYSFSGNVSDGVVSSTTQEGGYSEHQLTSYSKTSKNLYRCLVCEKEFPQKEDLEKHKKQYRDGNKWKIEPVN